MATCQKRTTYPGRLRLKDKLIDKIHGIKENNILGSAPTPLYRNEFWIDIELLGCLLYRNFFRMGRYPIVVVTRVTNRCLKRLLLYLYGVKQSEDEPFHH